MGSTHHSFVFHGYHAKFLKIEEELHAVGNEIRNFIQKTDNIFTKLKQTKDWIQTAMAIAQQEQQKYADKFKAQTPKYKIKNKIRLTLKNITTMTEMLRFQF